jgi:tRNA uridine 5-carboxymethylaminomethyl modification enzyme
VKTQEFDVIVIGAGHAGIEAALAAANLGSKVLLLCTNLNSVAKMPCNPSIGGPGKGHLVREIHALGGKMGEFIDAAYLQIRELNESRGPAVRALRAQADKKLYHLHVKRYLEGHRKITLLQGEAIEFVSKEQKIEGVRILTGLTFFAPSVVVATGTFLNGTIILGNNRRPGGPDHELPSLKLSEGLAQLGIRTRRLQTATPPRVAGKSINFDGLRELKGHEHLRTFTNQLSRSHQRSCFLTFTNQNTIDAVKTFLPQSPIVLGNITQDGPKHCPSIDRKVLRFPDKKIHQIFLEPESNLYDEWYLQGLTTSMPPLAQDAIVRSVKGLEQAEILRYGYAIEYDSISATQLRRTLESKIVSGLFFCGQVNGTSGYEEAAAQGLVAGINAHLFASNQPPFVLPTTTSYIGTLIDELVTHERTEPYRLTTSASQWRLYLRTDNAEERLIELGYQLGLVDREHFLAHLRELSHLEFELKSLASAQINPSQENQAILDSLGTARLRKPLSLADLLSRAELQYSQLDRFGYPCSQDTALISKIEIQLKYASFLEKLDRRRHYAHRLDTSNLPHPLNLSNLASILSPITLKRIQAVQPDSLGQLSRIQDIPANDLTLLLNAYSEGRL